MKHFFLMLMVAMVCGSIGLLVSSGCRTKEVRQKVELHVGYMICNSLNETMQRFEPLSSYLSDVLNVKIISHYLNTFDFEKELKKGYLDVAHTNSLLYIIIHDQYGWNLVAGEKEGSHGSSTAGVILVRRDSPLKTIQDLKGKRMIFGPELAPHAFLSQYYLLLENGFDPEMDLGYYAFAKGAFSHEQAVYAALYGGYDAASVPLLDVENMEREGKIAKNDYRFIATGAFIPYCTFSTSPKLEQEIRFALEKAILGISRDATARVGSEVLQVLSRAGVDGFEKLKDSDYDLIRRMAKRAKMPPYQEYQ